MTHIGAEHLPCYTVHADRISELTRPILLRVFRDCSACFRVSTASCPASHRVVLPSCIRSLRYHTVTHRSFRYRKKKGG